MNGFFEKWLLGEESGIGRRELGLPPASELNAEHDPYLGIQKGEVRNLSFWLRTDVGLGTNSRLLRPIVPSGPRSS